MGKLLGDEVLAQAGVGRTEAEEADQVDARRGDEGGEATEEFEGLEDELRLVRRSRSAGSRITQAIISPPKERGPY